MNNGNGNGLVSGARGELAGLASFLKHAQMDLASQARYGWQHIHMRPGMWLWVQYTRSKPAKTENWTGAGTIVSSKPGASTSTDPDIGASADISTSAGTRLAACCHTSICSKECRYRFNTPAPSLW